MIKFEEMKCFEPMSNTRLRVDCSPKAYVRGLWNMQS